MKYKKLEGGLSHEEVNFDCIKEITSSEPGGKFFIAKDVFDLFPWLRNVFSENAYVYFSASQIKAHNDLVDRQLAKQIKKQKRKNGWK